MQKSPQPSAPDLTLALRPALDLLAASRPPVELMRHGVELSNHLLSWGAGVSLLAAGLLHELVYQKLVRVDEVATACGERTAYLCDEYGRIFAEQKPVGWRGQAFALRRVSYYAAAYQDIELALLAAAHMWHSVAFGLAHSMTRPAATSLAIQRPDTRRILTPVLDMMGMREARDQIESLLTQQGDREPDPTRHRGEDDPLSTLLIQLEAGVPGVAIALRDTPFLAGDAAATSQTVDRALNRSTDKNHGQQSFFLDLVVPNMDACYQTLQLLHRHYRPVDGALVDTLAVARLNGHRSLQTSVVAAESGRRVRFNLRIAPPDLDQVNRWGAAALVLERFASLRSALESDAAYAGAWWRAAPAASPQIGAHPPGSLTGDTVVVFSPHGEPFVFERGSTVVDYAYSVHSDLAEQCSRFLVNGESVEPSTVLRHLDLVALEHSPHAPGPTVAWLSAARTKRARTRIRRSLRRLSEGVNEGQRIVEARRKLLEEYFGFRIADHKVDEAMSRAARTLGHNSADELVAEIAAGRVAPDRYLVPLFADEIVRHIDLPGSLRLRPHQIVLAQCCKPRLGEDIVGLPNRRKGILMRLTVHSSNCPAFAGLANAVRDDALRLRWRLRSLSRSIVQLEVTARDDDGLLGDALSHVYAVLPRVTLLKTDATANRGAAHLRFTFEVDSQETVEEIIDALRRLPGREISSVRQLALPPSEQEALQIGTQASNNPYSRMPVHDRSMFYGRTSELERIDDWLNNNITCIWLRGQKRVGKTSLLLHLRHRKWEVHQTACAFVDFQLFSNLSQTNIFFDIALAIYNDLERDPRVAVLGPPDRTQFDQDPSFRLVVYLRSLQQRLGARRLVLLLDEFSRITDMYLRSEISADFFLQWRGVLQATNRFCAFVTVVQQKTFDDMLVHMQTNPTDPCWHVLELGETLLLRPLPADDARRLIQWPLRNFVDYTPEALDRTLFLTGSSPFLIQAYCNKLVGHIAREGLRTVECADVDLVAEEFMQPAESIFAHLLDMAQGMGGHVCTELAVAIDAQERPSLGWPQVRAAVTNMDAQTLHSTLDHLCAVDILSEESPDTWSFRSALFQRWLARNAG
jgi:GTP pyrophosphokinase